MVAKRDHLANLKFPPSCGKSGQPMEDDKDLKRGGGGIKGLVSRKFLKFGKSQDCEPDPKSMRACPL